MFIKIYLFIICGSLTNKPVTISGGFIPLMIFVNYNYSGKTHQLAPLYKQGGERKREGEAEGERYSTLRCKLYTARGE